ncbi:hypothetical protein Dimus_021713 [Dionaea muscipula]
MANDHDLSATSVLSPIIISKEEFHAFHTIDRQLFSILIFNLGRNIEDSTQIMALWIWIERQQQIMISFVETLLAAPLPLVDAICEESVLCLKVMIRDDDDQYFPSSQLLSAGSGSGTAGSSRSSRSSSSTAHDHGGGGIPLLRSLLRMDISLRFFYENRVKVLRGVIQIVRDVCLKAFQDIVECKRSLPLFHSSLMTINFPQTSKINMITRRGALEFNDTGIIGSSSTTTTAAAAVIVDKISSTNLTELATSGGGGGGEDEYCNVDYDGEKKEEEEEEEEELGVDQVPADERTIFLTFSKGYPISHTEVDQFFKGLLGDVIEAIHMQEVENGEQALYARLVMRNAAGVRMMLRGQSRRVKFSINGKHAWARKYVRRTTPSPPNTPTSFPDRRRLLL